LQHYFFRNPCTQCNPHCSNTVATIDYYPTKCLAMRCWNDEWRQKKATDRQRRAPSNIKMRRNIVQNNPHQIDTTKLNKHSTIKGTLFLDIFVRKHLLVGGDILIFLNNLPRHLGLISILNYHKTHSIFYDNSLPSIFSCFFILTFSTTCWEFTFCLTNATL